MQKSISFYSGLALILILITSLLTSGAEFENGPSLSNNLLTVRVTHVKDGDSFDAITNDNTKIRIRLFGIDCPEYSQDFSQQAKQFTKNLIQGKLVNIELLDEDRYGRKLAHIMLSDQQLLNEALVAKGLCRWYQRYAPNNFKLEKLENTAREQRLGIWSLKNNIAPWDFRATERLRRQSKKD